LEFDCNLFRRKNFNQDLSYLDPPSLSKPDTSLRLSLRENSSWWGMKKLATGGAVTGIAIATTLGSSMVECALAEDAALSLESVTSPPSLQIQRETPIFTAQASPAAPESLLSESTQPKDDQNSALEQQSSSPPLRPITSLERNPSTQPLPDITPPAPLPPPDELLRPLPVTPAEPTVPGDSPQTITVERFEITGSTVFKTEDFTKITAPFTQRPISLAELFQVRDAITQLYIKQGYVTSGAYIPPQKLERGVVEIRILEGQLEGIKVTGTRRLRQSYIRSRLKLAAGPPLNRDRLLEKLQLLQLDPLIENISAELSAGTRPGSSLLEVKIKESRTFHLQLTLDNGRSPSVGTMRRKIQLNQANVLGFGDGVTVAYTNTDGSNALDFNYAVPVNARNGTVEFSYGTSFNQVIERPFSALDIESRASYYELTFRQPLLQSPTQEFALGLTAGLRESQATLFEGQQPFPASGADADGRTRIWAIRFFQEWTRRSTRQVLALRSQVNFGLGVFNATVNDLPPDSQFISWRGQVQWVRLVAPDTLFIVRGDIQLTNRPLVPLEQFGLGGIDSVRGYAQDRLLADNGAFISAEARIPVLRLRRINSLLFVTPFVDFGSVWNQNRGFSEDPNTIAGVGLGLRFQFSDRLTARFEWGLPLISVSGEKRTWQENGFYFSIVATPF
jgi:hemolysin activation/secretion protein